MSPSHEKILKEWYDAHDAAKDNASLLVKPYLTKRKFQEVHDLCVERMNRVGKADEALLSIPFDEAPAIVKLFIEADNNQACPNCKYSSRIGSMHEECRRKSVHWFACRDALAAYIKSYFENPLCLG